MAKPNKTTVYTLTLGEKILYCIIYGITYTLSLLPMCVLYLISDFLYFVIYKCAKYRKRLVRKNLTDSFPDKSETEIIEIERRFYHFLADYVVETLKLLSISKEEMRKRVKFNNIELITEVENQGRSVSSYIGHYCNWEWITSLGLYTQPNSFVGQVYHVMENRVVDKFFLNLRQRMGTKCVAMSEILRRRIECKQKGQSMVMGYIADQVPFWNSIHHWTDFLNHDTPVLTGAETITKRLNDRAVYFDISRIRRGYYNVDIILLTDNSKDVPDWEITDAYFSALEKTIIRQPEFWLWTHNRWKRTREKYIKKFGVEPSETAKKASNIVS